ncbi:hypothetical protein [Brevibacillus laterosporus]|uniref:hypothetical protein n=1 Tax=Brevibacillus laterosporus TaxID=1465 RepID=UPI000EB1F6F2|nr:hypothetical protein [Brevibacillus laterosporus]AYK05306.1 hypothetical protein D8Z77_02115 [Brevibacillus laterosporus]
MIEIDGTFGRQKLKDYEVRSLFFYSEYVKEEFPNIYQLVEEHQSNTRAIEMSIIEQLPAEDLRIVDNIISDIIIRCKNEWEGSPVPYEEIEGKDSIPCSLCNAPTKKIYHIKNTLSNRIINVGSTCIDQFLMDDKLAGKTKAQLRKEGERAKRLTYINEKFPGIKQLLERWDDELQKYDVLLPNILSRPYQDIGDEVRYQFQSYIDGNYQEEVFRDIEYGLQQQENFIEEFRKYNSEHMNNKFVVTSKIVLWLKKHGDLKTLEELKESGYVSYNTAANIHEPEFILKIIQEVSHFFTEQKITILGTDQDSGGIILQITIGQDIQLVCKFKSFLNHFRWIVFNERQFVAVNLYNILYFSEPYNQRSFDLLIEKIKDQLNDCLINLNLTYYHQQDHDLDLYDKRIEKYLTVDRKDFIKQFKTLLIKPENTDDIIDYVDELVRQGRKYQTWDDLKSLRELSYKY